MIIFVHFFVKWQANTYYEPNWVKMKPTYLEKSTNIAIWPPDPPFRDTVHLEGNIQAFWGEGFGLHITLPLGGHTLHI